MASVSLKPQLFCLALACRGTGGPAPDEGDTMPVVGDTLHEGGVQSCSNRTSTYSEVHLDGPAAATHRFTGGGIAVFDANGDTYLDLLVATADGPRMWVGPDFEPAATPSIAGSLTGVSAADADNDGDLDVFWSRFGAPDVFWRNDAPGFEEVDVGISGPSTHSQSSAWADLNGDGWLDLIVAGHGDVGVEDDQISIDRPGDPTRVYYGSEGLVFTEATGDLPAAFQDAYTFLASPIDLDDDGRLDLFGANDHPAWSPQQSVYNRDTWFELDDGTTGLQPHGAGMGLGVGDTNGDHFPDLLLPVWDRLIFLESGAQGWVEASQARGLRLPPHATAWVGWGAELADLNNDGLLDAVVAFGHLDALAPNTLGGSPSDNADEQPILTWQGRTHGGFDLTDLGLDDPGAHRGFVLADLNRDGVLDLAAPDLTGGVDLRLSTCSDNAWLTVSLEQEGPNRHGIGAIVTATTPTGEVYRTLRAGGTSVLSSGPPEVHLGLGAADKVSVMVQWPDGLLQRFDSLATRQAVRVQRYD